MAPNGTDWLAPVLAQRRRSGENEGRSGEERSIMRAIVVGGGLVGSTLAGKLAADGQSASCVQLFADERDAG